MKVVFFGTPYFAVPTLKALLKSDIEVCAVVTQPDRKRGRGMNVLASPVKFAVDRDIPILQPLKINTDAECIEQIKAMEPDFFVVIAYGQIFSKKVISIPKKAPINLHASLLPLYRGASPIQQALLHGDTVTGVTSIHMTRKMDAGDMLLKYTCELSHEDEFCSTHDKLSELAAECCIETLYNFDSITPEQQDHEHATYCSKITKDMGKISFDDTAENIFNKIRAFSEFPCIQVKYEKTNFKIHEAEIVGRDYNEFEPGQIVWVSDSELIVKCSDHSLSLKTLQRSGKKRMKYADLQRGFKFEKGKYFTSLQ